MEGLTHEQERIVDYLAGEYASVGVDHLDNGNVRLECFLVGLPEACEAVPWMTVMVDPEGWAQTSPAGMRWAA